MTTAEVAGRLGASVRCSLCQDTVLDKKEGYTTSAEQSVINDMFQQSLLFLSDVTMGVTSLTPREKKQLADSVEHTRGGAALDVLELVPFPQLVPRYVPPKLKARILSNVETAQAALHWPDKTAAVATVKAAELWYAESLIEPRLSTRKTASTVVPPNLSIAMTSIGVPAAALDEIEGMVSALGAISCDASDADLDVRLKPKLAEFVLATTQQSSASYPRTSKCPLETVRSARHWAAAVVNNPEMADAAGLAALVGICASRASCRNERDSLWLTWLQMIRALAPKASMSELCMKPLANACVAPFSSHAGKTLIGEHASSALGVLGRLSNVYVDFAALRIGCNPGVDALSAPSQALEFLSIAMAHRQPVCVAIIEFLCSVLGD